METKTSIMQPADQKPLPSPAPQAQPQTESFSPLFHSNSLQKATLLNSQQQEKQNQLVATCLKGDLALVKQLEGRNFQSIEICISRIAYGTWLY